MTSNYDFARFILRILCRTDIRGIGHIDRRVKSIYFKAWQVSVILRMTQRFLPVLRIYKKLVD